MSIKKLFDKGKTSQVVTSTDLQNLSEDIESTENLKERFEDVNRFVPTVDFTNPENFARFGSAEKYYTDAMDRIVRYYPYDGSEAEQNEFRNESSYVDNHIFDNLYPRTTGFAKFSPHDPTNDNGGWGANDTNPAASRLYYGEPTIKEYIEVRGGPHTGSNGMLSGAIGISFTGSNFYSTDIYAQAGESHVGRDGTRESNLRMNLDDGMTVEFWLKKESFLPSQTQREVVFDLWNQVTSSSPQYGRFRVELTASGFAENGADPFRLTFLSGGVVQDSPNGSGFESLPLGGSTVTTSSVADNKWHHYAFSVVNERAVAAGTIVRFYRDGQLVDTIATGSVAEEVTGSLIGFIGALQTQPSRSAGSADSMVGWGKLSGSIDEFRYWKARRTSEQISDNYFTQVRGGTNTDIANTELGVYYKFNEGITGDASIDSTVLDYSGRISNGRWFGYAADARATGSAIIEYSGSTKTEYKDPIIYPSHPDVEALRANLAASASYHDVRNNSSIFQSLPSWMIEDDDESGGQLKNLTQIIGNYFDTLYLQIEAIKDLHVPTYQTSSGKALPFANRLLESKGFINSEIFANAEVLEAVMNRDTEREYSADLHNIKNLIYQNIYNNLVHIFKTKGTEKSFHNLIRSFGVDEELIRINLYADNTTHLLRDNFRPKAVRKNFVDFYQSDNHDAVVTHDIRPSTVAAAAAKHPEAVGVTYISASHKDFSTTAEAEVIFPRLKEPGDAGFVELSFTDSSIFGWDQARTDPDNFNKLTNGSGYQVLAIRPSRDSKDAFFKLVDRSNNLTIATSSLFKDVYDDNRWVFALRTRNVMTSSIAPSAPNVSHGMGTFLTGAAGIRAKAVDCIDLAGVEASSADVSFTILIPTSAGGEHDTTAVTILLDDSATTDPAEGANTIAIGTAGISDADKTAAVIDAINGVTSSLVDLASSGVGANNAIGVQGVTATAGSTNTKITLSIDLAGDAGNLTNAITAVSGVDVVDLRSFSGGLDGTHVEVSLYGVHTAYDRVQEEFSLSGNAIHSDITVPRRYYVGARRDNFVGGTIHEQSSVKVGYLRHWQMYLNNHVIQAHSRDSENYGTFNPFRSTYLLENPLTGTYLPEIQTLSFNWDFSNITGSDASGEFKLEDFSSGSLLKRRFRDPDIDPIVNNQYLARGHFFKTSTTAAVDTNYVSSARYRLPETLTSYDMIDIRTQDDLTFTKETRPISHFFAFEKSMYQAISEEMINMFAGINEFNNLIGEPVNKYRYEYKDMSKLRQIFYENVENTPDLDKYLSYYKWLDTALGEMLQQLVPASSRFSDDIRNVIEDTALTRNKYRHILPTLRTPKLEIEGHIKGIEEMLYRWDIGHAPMNNKATKVVHPQPEDKNCLWWRQRAERQGASVTSDRASVDRSVAQVAIIDEQRNIYKKVGYSYISASVPQFTALKGTDGATKVGINNVPIYTGSYYPNNRFSRVYRLFVGTGFSSLSVIGAWNGYLIAGHNPTSGDNSKYTFWRTSTNPVDSTRLIEVSNIIDQTGCEYKNSYVVLPPKFPSKDLIAGGKKKLDATATSSPASKARDLPFSLYMSDVTTGYKSSIAHVNVRLSDGSTSLGKLELNNIHQDIYESGEDTLQGPFTKKYVGGLPHRHVDLNTSKGVLDGPTNRLEGFKLSFTADTISVSAPPAASDDRGSANPEIRGDFYRNVKTKRPLNIANIRQLTGSHQLNHIGNFSSFREIIQISDRDINNRAFVKHEGKGPFRENSRARRIIRGFHTDNPFALLGEFKDVAKPNFYISGSSHRENDIISLGSNQFAESNTTDYIFVERFSAPGGPETAGDSMGGAALDYGSAQYSPYNNLNYRNLSVRLPLRRMLTDHANQFGLKSDASTAEQNAAGAAHDAYNPSTVSSFDYSGVPAFHDVNRNSRLRFEFSSSRQTAETVIRKPIHDNFFVQREIPSTTTRYAWITGSLTHIPGHQTTVLGHPRPDGTVSSSVSFDYGLAQGASTAIAGTLKSVGPGDIPALNFVSASDIVTRRKGSTNLADLSGVDKRSADPSGYSGLLPVNFVGMNQNVRQVINTGSLILSGAGPGHVHAQNSAVGRVFADHTRIGTAPFYKATELYLNRGDTSTFLFEHANTSPQALVLNMLNLNRNGPYGYPSFKQIRTGETRVGRYLRRNNIISFNESPGRHFVTEDAGRGRIEVIERFSKPKLFREPPVTSRHKPTEFVLGFAETYEEEGREVTAVRPVDLQATYGNEMGFFGNVDLDIALGRQKLKPVGYQTITDFYLRGGLESPSTPIESFIEFKYTDTVYPKERNTYTFRARTRTGFQNNFWRDGRSDRFTKGAFKPSFNGFTAAGSATARVSSWNLDAVPESEFTVGPVGVADVMTGSGYETAGGFGGGTGLLQNPRTFLHFGNATNTTASAMYARPHMLETSASVRSLTGPAAVIGEALVGAGKPLGRIKIFGGMTMWDAGRNAGSVKESNTRPDKTYEFKKTPTTPFYDSYEDYSEDLRVIAQDYAIVPEFRISEHMDFYVKGADGNFLAPNPRILSVVHSERDLAKPDVNTTNSGRKLRNPYLDTEADITDLNFFTVYSNSDFMKNFAEIREEHSELVNPTEIKLTCKAAMKFLPYDGFYPAERTFEIAQQFSQSYGANIAVTGAPTAVSDKRGAALRPITQPLFAPGIMFNTIKSGMAVDYPIYTGPFKRHNPKDAGSSNAATNYIMMSTASSPNLDDNGKIAGWDFRLPFETLVEPERYLTDLTLVDMEVHPSSALPLTASWNGHGDRIYKMMANNFFAAVPEFFLPNGEFSTLKSKPQKQFKGFDTGSIYGLRIKLRKSYNRGRQPDRLDSYIVPQDMFNDANAIGATFSELGALRETFTMYSRPSAFGPPMSGRHTIGATGSSDGATYEKLTFSRQHIADSLIGLNPSFTPPYYDGEAWCDVLFRPSSSFATLGDILAESKKVYWRFDNLALGSAANDQPYGNLNINKFAMQLTASFNLFQRIQEPSVTFDESGRALSVAEGSDEKSVWVIQPKFETPMFNFNDVFGVNPIVAGNNFTVPINNSESVARGIWHQFGAFPTDPQEGIFLDIEPIPDNFINNRVSLYVSGSPGRYGSGDASSHPSSLLNDWSYDDTNYAGFYGGYHGVAASSSSPVLSLLDVVEFDQKSMRLGETANKLKASEAVVAIPFIEEAGERKFFKVDKELVQLAIDNPETEEVGESIKHMIRSVDKYVMPPTMDFVAFRDEVDPIAMYFFEFEFEFDKNDLAHMWQNLMPPSGKIVKKAETTVGHKLILNEMLGLAASETGRPLEDQMKWMVFKVKQRANMNYFSKVAGADADADDRYRFEFKAGRASEEALRQGRFGFNWPFDFFSMVELIKLESEIKFSGIDESIDSELVTSSERDLVSGGITPDGTGPSSG